MIKSTRPLPALLFPVYFRECGEGLGTRLQDRSKGRREGRGGKGRREGKAEGREGRGRRREGQSSPSAVSGTLSSARRALARGRTASPPGTPAWTWSDVIGRRERGSDVIGRRERGSDDVLPNRGEYHRG